MSRLQKVYVGLSGGVDSSVAALLLQQQDYDVTGVFMKNFDPELFGAQFSEQCHWAEDQEDARKVAEKLNIPFKIWNFEKEYYADVIDYFFTEYEAGRTPNPDVMCNKYIKFGRFLDKALADGADFVATGHYARLRQEITNYKLQITNNYQTSNSKTQTPSHSELASESNAPKTLDQVQADSETMHSLFRGKDLNKDQSYFLWTITQKQLQRILFPIGELAKDEVRNIAKKNELITADKPDSQGICFVGEIDISELIKTRLPEKAGMIQTTKGEIIGEHRGVQFFTEGQRKGLGIGGGIPYFVAKKDAKQNVLTVAKGFNDPVLFSKELTASNVNWISDCHPELVEGPLKCQAQIRYRQDPQACTVAPLKVRGAGGVMNNKKECHPKLACQPARQVEGRHSEYVNVIFDSPQRAITPGQSIVFYDQDQLLGGAIIEAG